MAHAPVYSVITAVQYTANVVYLDVLYSATIGGVLYERTNRFKVGADATLQDVRDIIQAQGQGYFNVFDAEHAEATAPKPLLDLLGEEAEVLLIPEPQPEP